MKDFIKKCVPEKWIIKYRSLREHRKVKNEFIEEASQYNNWTNFHLVGNSDNGVKELLIFHTHALEKGLSHPNFRSNFGKNALRGLRSNLTEFNKRSLNKADFAYQNAISVLKFYKDKHNQKNIETPFFDSLFKLDEFEDGLKIAGAEVHEKKETQNMNFAEFSNYRTTQREFSSLPVEVNEVKSAIKLAMKTPSVCNRQPWNVYMTKNESKISKLLQIQKGFKGYGLPPVLSLITVDRQAFIGSYERNEAYIDGGLFLMNFDFALTYTGLASCILNTMLPIEKQNKIRDILNIPYSDVLIAFVAIGHPKSELLTAKSSRKPTKDILNVVN